MAFMSGGGGVIISALYVYMVNYFLHIYPLLPLFRTHQRYRCASCNLSVQGLRRRGGIGLNISPTFQGGQAFLPPCDTATDTAPRSTSPSNKSSKCNIHFSLAC